MTSLVRPKDLPGIHKPIKPSGKLTLRRGEIKRTLFTKEVKALCGNKDKYPINFVASSAGYQLENADFLKDFQPSSLKEYVYKTTTKKQKEKNN